MLKKIAALSVKPQAILGFLAVLGVVTTLFAGWGLWRMSDMSAEFKNRDDRMLVLGIDIKEDIASFSKLTYDFLLQQDFNRMLMKEKQSNATRDEITGNLASLVLQSEDVSSETIDTIKMNVMQFLTLTDKALETAVEEGSAVRARMILQDEVEPALKKAQDSLNALIQSRQKFSAAHSQFLRQQALIFISLLVGLTALGMALLMTLRLHLVTPRRKAVKAFMEAPVERLEGPRPARVVEAPSLATLAFMNRFSRLHKESDDLKRIVAGMQRLMSGKPQEESAPVSEKDMKELAQQGDKIAMAVGRIQNINEQSKQFIDKLAEMMAAMQGLATDGNIVALNVTIEMAKMQSQLGSEAHDDKNMKVSEQIRALATTAANITGKMAMVLSQFRYAQDDFSKQTLELMNIKNNGLQALEHIKQTLHATTQSTSTLMDERAEFENYLPVISQKVDELEQEIEQLQLFANEEVESHRQDTQERTFRVISGRAA